MSKKYAIILSICFAVSAVFARISPHPWNFTPMGAVFIFSGFLLPRKLFWIPLLSLAVSDLLIGSYNWQVMMSVYSCYFASYAIAYFMKEYNLSNVIYSSVFSSLVFFFITNFAHWMWFGGYSRDFYGLASAYIAGIPFFRNSMAGYLFFGFVFYFSYDLLRRFVFQKNFSVRKI